MTSESFRSRVPNPYSMGWSFNLSIMDRYIISELLPIFLFGVASFSSIGVAIGALFDLVRKITEAGVPVSLAVQILLLKLPEFVGYAFPMSTLLAALMTYSRFSSDSELVALRSCGVSLYRLVAPVLAVSLIVTGITFVFNEVVVPGANFQAAVTLERALKQEKPNFQEKNILYQDFREVPQPNGTMGQELVRLFHAEEFDGQEMKNLTILDYSREGLNQIVVAKSASWNFKKNIWEFTDGTIYVIAPDSSYRNILRFEKQELQLPRAPLDLASRGRDYGEMNIAESQDYLKLLRQSGDLQKVRKLEVIIQKKYALPFVCVVFGLIGSVLGTRPQRTSRAKGFGLSILIIFGYYLLVVICEAMGYTGLFSPVVAGWLPNVSGLMIGTFLLTRAAR